MDEIVRLAEENQRRAWKIIKETNIIELWESIGAEIHLVGSLRMGLLMNHRDIDFHIYTLPLKIADSFCVMERLAENPAIKRIEYGNSIDTEERCIEWHAWYQDEEDELWQIDMIHIEKGSIYDGFFERMAQRIMAVLTEEQKEAILRLKLETPDTEKIMGVEYYQAVIRDGVRTFEELKEWKKIHPITGIIEWIP